MFYIRCSYKLNVENYFHYSIINKTKQQTRRPYTYKDREKKETTMFQPIALRLNKRNVIYTAQLAFDHQSAAARLAEEQSTLKG
jgi:hypothetical protein